MDAFAGTLRHARWYGTGTESGSTALAAEDATYQFDVTSGNVSCQYRCMIEETGSGSIDGATTDDYTLQYRKNGTGSYSDIPATSSGVGLQVATSGLTNGNATTQRLTGGAGSFVAGEQATTASGVVDRQLTANNFTEHVYGVEWVAADLLGTDTWEFRVALNGGSPGLTIDVTLPATIKKGTTHALSGTDASRMDTTFTGSKFAPLTGSGASRFDTTTTGGLVHDLTSYGVIS